MAKIYERVKFKFMRLPCCGHGYCSVNPRLPNYCPECGEPVYAKLMSDPQCILITDDDAVLEINYK